MKSHLSLFVVLLLLLSALSGKTQAIQWAALQSGQNNLLNLRVGAEYGLIAGVGYGRVLNTQMPIVLSAGFSFPSGKNLTDDFKTGIGGQVRWANLGGFHFSSELQGTFKRYESIYVRLLDIGLDVSTTVGYYRPKWFTVAEAGYDLALATQFRHKSAFRENYPGVKDSWYSPATSGHFYCDLLAGFSLKKQDVYLKAGKILEQDLKTQPFLPFYLELGGNRRF